MDRRPTTLERAFELARSGEYRTVTQIRERLSAEGRMDVQGQLYGVTIRNKLRAVMTEAGGRPAQKPPGSRSPGQASPPSG
jgi:hypothetical protein